MAGESKYPTNVTLYNVHVSRLQHSTVQTNLSTPAVIPLPPFIQRFVDIQVC